MNKIIKRILFGIGLVVAIFALLMGGFMLKMKSEKKKMNVIPTKEIVRNVYAIDNSFVNMFVVKDSDSYVAIDAGNDIETVVNELKNLNINPDRVLAVFLTHTDGDHVAALKLFKNSVIYLSKDEEQMINGKTTKMMFYHNKLDIQNYRLLCDQQIVKVGNIRIVCIQTPGHTPGSMSYLLNDKYLFVGDAFGLKNGKIDKPNSFFSKDMKLGIKSFQKIKNLPKAEYVFTAHNGFSNDYNNAINTVLK